MSNYEEYKSRKFILALAGLAISSVLVWFGRISGGDFVTLNSVLGGAYMAANAVVRTSSYKYEKSPQ